MESVEHLPSWLLTQTAGFAGRMVSARFADVGARGYHYRVLSSLATEGPASQADLGRRVGIHLSDMVKALNELEADGFVQRVPSPDDRRRNIITITDGGRARAEQLARQVGSIQEELLEPLDRVEREQLTTLLAKLYRHHRVREAAPPPMD
ncbi:MarR family winged helix-turn-helix transcriptional regulator [Actinoplanes sp. CA-142083]|uniref:MarR family winged helix-turn-helix transcriptional regulator n=1 Tax=Actinoplanes sp. CA-142083 TaxID=3239903 RepID=UPI003D942605